MQITKNIVIFAAKAAKICSKSKNRHIVARNTHAHMAEKKKGKTGAPKTPEAAARVRAHQFGQPGGNKRHPITAAVAQRDFYRWVECEATEAELKAYVADESNPYVRRKFVAAMTSTKKVEDHFALANQVHGAPKQPIELQELPKIECHVFGDD